MTEAPLPATERALYAWQRAAFEAWRANGRRGVVEAVTGSGKTELGIRAVRERLETGGVAAVMVPTVELMHQWARELGRALPERTLGLLGDGQRESLGACEVLIATVSSARARRVAPRRRAALLVADECHRFAGPVNRLALGAEFDWRLGLTAAHARIDRAHETVLGPYFGGVVYRYGYADALGEGVVSPFKVATIAVDFEPDEREQYEYLTEKVYKARQRLVLYFGVPMEPFGEFMARVNDLRMHGTRSESIAAGRYLAAFNRRRELLAETGAKAQGLAKIAEAFRCASRAIVFTQTVRGAELATAELVDLGIDAEALHSHQHTDERRAVLGRFARGHLHTIVAPQVLDEGLDVPDADLGVVVAASRQRRQMIQRLGRVLRPKTDRRLARLAVLYVRDTGEDPFYGAHETFLEEIARSAALVRDFGVEASAAEICAYLSRA